MVGRACGVVALVSLIPSVAVATDYEVDPSMNYRQVMAGLQPGDTLLVRAGRYTNGFGINTLNGTAAQPILIAGPTAGPRAIIVARSCCNTIGITNSSYLRIQSLDLEGNGEFVDAIKAESNSNYAHHITLEDLHISGHGSDQQIVGISTKSPAWDWVVRYNVIERAGTGMYLGNSDGADPFVRGVIEYNVIIDPVGYCMEIKHQNPRPNVAGMPTGQSVTIIRHNVFTKASNASTGGSARPNLLVGHWPPSGAGQNDRYEIYGNFFHQNRSGSEPLFQGEGNVALHDNVMVNGFGSAILVRPQNGDVRNIFVYHNTVFADGDGVAIFNPAGGFTPLVVGNAVFAGTPITNADGTVRDNVTGRLADANMHVNNAQTNLAGMDFYPRAGALSGGAIDVSAFASHIDSNLDFNGNARPGTYRGAYGGAGTNPGWTLAIDTKPGGMRSPGVPQTPPDAGVPIDAGQMPPADTGPRPIDAGARRDAGGGGPDAGGAGPDAGGGTFDAALVVDSGGGITDAWPDPDGTVSMIDAGTNRARSPSIRGDTGGGCQCVSGPKSTAVWLFVSGLLLLRWRKQG